MSRYQLYLVGKGSWTDFLGCFDTWLSASCADVDKNVFYALIPMSNLLWWDTGLPADLKTQQEDVSNSHCEDGNIFKIHTPLSILVACLKGSNSGLAKDVFGSERTTSTVAILGLPRGTAGGGGGGRQQKGLFLVVQGQGQCSVEKHCGEKKISQHFEP